MDRFVCSSMAREELRFTVRIEKFSMYVCRGYFESPEFESESSSCWSLVVYASDGADYDNYVDVRLKRNACYTSEEQFVKAKVSIVDCFGRTSTGSEKELFFQGSSDAQVLSVTKERMFGYFGLNKLRLLPNDTLTLLCQLVIHKDAVATFRSKEDFMNNLIPPVSRGVRNFQESFAHSRVTRHPFDFSLRLNNFSTFAAKSCYVSPEFYSDFLDCDWNLVICPCDEDFGEDFLDVRLRRSDLNRRSYFAEVKVSLADRFGIIPLCVKNEVYFRGSQVSEEVPVLTLREKYVLGVGMNKLLYLPCDALTLHCEIVVYEDTVDTFVGKDDYERSVKKRDGCARSQMFPWLWSYIDPLHLLVVGLICACYGIWYAIFPFIVDCIRFAIGHAALFLGVVLVCLWGVFKIKKDAESIMMAKARNKNRVWKNKSDAGSIKDIVPYQTQEVVPYRLDGGYYYKQRNYYKHRNY